MTTISRFGVLCATAWIAACGTEVSTEPDLQGPSSPETPGGASRPNDAPGGTDGSAQGASSALRLRVPGGERVTLDRFGPGLHAAERGIGGGLLA